MSKKVLVQAFQKDGEELSLALATLIGTKSRAALFQAYRMAHRFYSDAKLLHLPTCEALGYSLLRPLETAHKQRCELNTADMDHLQAGLELLQQRLIDVHAKQTEAEKRYTPIGACE